MLYSVLLSIVLCVMSEDYDGAVLYIYTYVNLHTVIMMGVLYLFRIYHNSGGGTYHRDGKVVMSVGYESGPTTFILAQARYGRL
jgi:hypothetical protein